jgi:hypothetical protein
MLSFVDPQRAQNYELTLAGPLTKLPTLPKPPSSEGTSQCCNGLTLSPRYGWQSNGGKFAVLVMQYLVRTLPKKIGVKKCLRLVSPRKIV